MLMYLAKWLRTIIDIPGARLFDYVSFRAACAAITALLISFVIGPRIIALLKKMIIGEQAKRELQEVGGHSLKKGTPTMGGLIVLTAMLAPVLLWADITNAFVILLILVTAFLGGVGFLDDYLKVIKKLPNGLIGRYKLAGQVTIGLTLAVVIYFFPHVFPEGFAQWNTFTTIPFAKHMNFDWGVLYIPAVVFIITATSNAVNLTDGLDGLSIGTVGIVALALAVICYVSGNSAFAGYLNIIHLRGADELTIVCAALVGASLGFLWFNSYPAQVFMGDTGALALGGAIGTICILVKKEFLLPILGGVFFAETISVLLQVGYFKYTKKKFGAGKRLFKMAPIHHHFEKSGWHESKIVTRFYIVAVMLAIITMTTFKVR